MGTQSLKPQPKPMMQGTGKPQNSPMPDAGMAGGNMLDQLRASQGQLGGMAGGNMPMQGQLGGMAGGDMPDQLLASQGQLGGMDGGNMPMQGMRMPDAGIMPVPRMEMPTDHAPDAGIGMPPGERAMPMPAPAQPMPGQDNGRAQFDAIQNLSRMAPQVMRAQGGKRLQRPPMPRQGTGGGGLPPAQWFQTNNGVQR